VREKGLVVKTVSLHTLFVENVLSSKILCWAEQHVSSDAMTLFSRQPASAAVPITRPFQVPECRFSDLVSACLLLLFQVRPSAYFAEISMHWS